MSVVCIRCGIEMDKIKTGTSICLKCAGELTDSMSPTDRLAHAKVGLDAFIDEVTGYEKIRPHKDLSKRLKGYKEAK